MWWAGWQQVARYSSEPSPGMAIVPATDIGIVTGGSVYERQNVYSFYGPESRLPVDMGYSRTTCGGTANFIVQDIDFLLLCLGRNGSEKEVDNSFTLDCGVCDGYKAVYPRRMVGSKVSKVSLTLEIDHPMEAEVNWDSLYVTDGTIPIDIGDPLWEPPFWLMERAQLWVNNVIIDDILSISLEIDNKTTPRYLATRSWGASSGYAVTSNPRTPSYIRSGNQTISMKFKTYNNVGPVLRGIEPLWNGLYAGEGLTLYMRFVDICRNKYFDITLTGVYQLSLEEPFQPMDYVEFSVDMQAAAWTMTEGFALS